MHPVAYSVSRRGLMLPRNDRIAVLQVSRGFSRRAVPSTKPTSNGHIATRKTWSPSKNNKQQQPIHSSAKTQQPTLSMEKEAAAQQVEEAVVTPPSMEQLKVLFSASAVPMIGFGMMDNIVMIQAGQLIDNTIGVTMGLATLTAAAAGQVVSDVSGVIFGGSLERFLHQHKLITASTLTTAQRALPVSRNAAMFGAVCGVMLGCGLGASCLLFMDLEARERAERAIQLQAVLNDMMEEAGDGVELRCDSCIIHLAHLPADKHFSTDHTKDTGKTKITVLPTTPAQNNKQDESASLAVRAARECQSITNEDASVLCTPIFSQKGEVVAVLEFRTKKDAVQGFADRDKKAAKVMARHIGIFMHRLSD